MAPRAYSLGKRREQVSETRQRVVEAAASLFRESGIQLATMTAIAIRAGVAPGTVFNHFPNKDELVRAVLDHIMGRLRFPTSEIFRRTRSTESRLRVLVDAMFEFYDRSNEWYEMYRRERDASPAIQQAEQLFWAGVRDLYQEGVGPWLGNRRVATAIFGLTGPATLGSLKEADLTVGDAARPISDMLVLLARREVGRQVGSGTSTQSSA